MGVQERAVGGPADLLVRSPSARHHRRSPFVDVPLVTYESQSGPSLFCVFAGRETPLSDDVLTDLYVDVDAYLEAFTESLDATIDAGFLLKMDRAEILAAAPGAKARAAGGCATRRP